MAVSRAALAVAGGVLGNATDGSGCGAPPAPRAVCAGAASPRHGSIGGRRGRPWALQLPRNSESVCGGKTGCLSRAPEGNHLRTTPPQRRPQSHKTHPWGPTPGGAIRTLTPLFFLLWHPLSDVWWLPTNRHRLPTNRHRLPTNRHRLPTNRHRLHTNCHRLHTNCHRLHTNRHRLHTNCHRLPTNRHRLPTGRHRRAYWTLRVFFFFIMAPPAPRTQTRSNAHRPHGRASNGHPTPSAEGRTGDSPEPRQETNEDRNVTHGVCVWGGVGILDGCLQRLKRSRLQQVRRVATCVGAL